MIVMASVGLGFNIIIQTKNRIFLFQERQVHEKIKIAAI